jgi:hypothetical protein
MYANAELGSAFRSALDSSARSSAIVKSLHRI